MRPGDQRGAEEPACRRPCRARERTAPRAATSAELRARRARRSPGARARPRAAASTATSASASAVVATRRVVAAARAERLHDVGGRSDPASPRSPTVAPVSGSGAPASPATAAAARTPTPAWSAAAPRAAGRLDGERHEREEPERREQRARHEQQPGRASRHVSGEPARARGGRRRAQPPVRRCRAGRPARRARARARAAVRGAWRAPRPAQSSDEHGRRPERQERAADGRRAAARAAGGSRCASGIAARPTRRGAGRRRWRDAGRSRATLPRSRRRRTPRAARAASCDGGRPPAGSIASALSTAASRRLGQVGRAVRERRRAGLRSSARPPGAARPRTGACPRAPPRAARRPPRRRSRRVASSPRSRSGEMYASVPGTSPTAVSVSASSNCASPKSSSRTAISSRSSRRTFDGLTSRWTIPRAVRVREPVEDLRGGLDGVARRSARPRGSPRAACCPRTYSYAM